MVESTQRPSPKVFLRVVWEDWGSRVSGVASVPSTLLGFFTTTTYAKNTWFVIAVLCVLLAAYRAWVKERERVIELHGRPEVLLAGVQVVEAKNVVANVLQLTNSSNSVATNITISDIRVQESDGNRVEVEFRDVSHLSRDPANVEYVIHGTGGKSRRDLLACLGLDKRVSLQKTPHAEFTTVVGFSNYGGTGRWEIQYTLECDFTAHRIFCRPGVCNKVQ